MIIWQSSGSRNSAPRKPRWSRRRAASFRSIPTIRVSRSSNESSFGRALSLPINRRFQPQDGIQEENMNSVIQHARRVIIKVGSSLVTNDGKGLDHVAIAKWAEQIAHLRALGKEVVLVSSGAIAEGMQR